MCIRDRGDSRGDEDPELDLDRGEPVERAHVGQPPVTGVPWGAHSATSGLERVTHTVHGPDQIRAELATQGLDVGVDGAGAARVHPVPHPVSYTHLRAHETRHDLVCRLLLE